MVRLGQTTLGEDDVPGTMEAPLKNKAVLLDGTAEIVTTGVKEMTPAIHRKYMGADAAKSPRAQDSIATPRALIKITPTTVHSNGYDAAPAPWQPSEAIS